MGNSNDAMQIGTYLLSSDVDKIVIEPIEEMVCLVKKISSSPLDVDYDAIVKEYNTKEQLETTILLQSLAKVGALAKVGFGQAGADIIAKCTSNNLQSTTLNLMNSGSVIDSIFGFCDIRQFTDTTECLQEEVMIFVNRVALIVHDIVAQCGGAANKNVGDAFLLTWKLDDERSNNWATNRADRALLAFLKILILIHKNQVFDFYCQFYNACSKLKFLPPFSALPLQFFCTGQRKTMESLSRVLCAYWSWTSCWLGYRRRDRNKSKNRCQLHLPSCEYDGISRIVN